LFDNHQQTGVKTTMLGFLKNSKNQKMDKDAPSKSAKSDKTDSPAGSEGGKEKSTVKKKKIFHKKTGHRPSYPDCCRCCRIYCLHLVFF
jgi:hypothetical protein